MTSRAVRSALLALALAGAPRPAAAQFELTQVSGLGQTPLRMSKTTATFEDLSATVPGIRYNIYRRLPADGFRCYVPGLATPAWTVDAVAPTLAVWWYTVNGYDGTVENLHGNQVAIVQPCHEGACCTGTTCTTATPAACAQGGGTYRGDAVACTATLCQPPATGACCIGATCSIIDRNTCTATGGGYRGDGTTCTPNPCATLTGACCDPVTRACTDVTSAACAATCGGVFAGNGTTCAANGCTTGACCSPAGCTLAPEAACATSGGRFLGYWTTCGATTCACTPVAGTPPLRLVRVDPPGSFTRPLHMASPPGDDARLFVVEKTGRIRILRGGTVLATPFLDIRTSVLATGNEQGLLSMAFHPDYLKNGKFYVDYTAPGGGASGHTVVEEFQVSANPDVADLATRRVLLTVDDPFSNHNGGQLAFSPRDRYLYISLGDGGSGDDPGNRAQDRSLLFGKLMRIDVSCAVAPAAYRIPADNPFVGQMNVRPEIWAYGLRNPWRFSFDRQTADLYIGDVGQGCWEEIDVQAAASRGGENYGWKPLEGFHCRIAGCGTNLCGAACPAALMCAAFVPPLVEFSHGGGRCSVTGGKVYRGCSLPGYAGTYFYSDYCGDDTHSFVYSGGAATNPLDWTTSFTQVAAPTSYAEDANGEIYILNDNTGGIYRISN